MVGVVAASKLIVATLQLDMEVAALSKWILVAAPSKWIGMEAAAPLGSQKFVNQTTDI